MFFLVFRGRSSGLGGLRFGPLSVGPLGDDDARGDEIVGNVGPMGPDFFLFYFLRLFVWRAVRRVRDRQ